MDHYHLIAWGHDDKRLLEGDCQHHRVSNDWLEHYWDLKKSYQVMMQLNKPVGFKTALSQERIPFEGRNHFALNDAENLARLFLLHFGSWPLAKVM